VDASATRPGYVNWTPLHLAAVRGYTEILQVLLKAKACVGAGSLEVEDLNFTK
jgi:ankyrin repeat protein